MSEKETEDGVEWYTTTFKIPVWLRDKMKEFSDEKGMSGMNMVVVTACTSFIFTQEKRKANNDLASALFESGGITEEEKETLWVD